MTLKDSSVPEQDPGSEQSEVTLTEQWQTEQRNWQHLLQTFADSAAQDENFLMHVGNAMRGSLLAGKPYPGTALEQPGKVDATMTSDEVVFAVRRLEGQITALTAAIDALHQRLGPALRDGPVNHQ
jgi:hypothetical protein